MRDDRDFFSGMAVAALGALLVWQTTGRGIILFEDDIDPMLYPRIIAAILCGIGLLVAGRALVRRIPAAADIPLFTRRTVGISVVLLLYAGFFPLVGFAVSSFLAGCAVAMLMGWRRPLSLVVVNIAAVACLWLLFTKGLRIALPGGTLF